MTTPPADKPTVGVNNAGAATGEVNGPNRPMRAANEWYPDHVVYATKEQLKGRCRSSNTEIEPSAEPVP
jgi:hypothetical protein